MNKSIFKILCLLHSTGVFQESCTLNETTNKQMPMLLVGMVNNQYISLRKNRVD